MGGFKQYQPSPNSLRYVYAVTTEDAMLVPSGFRSSWGVVQPLQSGDFLAMPYPAANEIYLMPAEVRAMSFSCAQAKDGSGGSNPNEGSKPPTPSPLSART